MVPAKRLYRSDEKMIAGVAAGLSQYLGVPKLLLRFVFLALLFIGPGLPLYVFFWLLTPRDPADGYVVRKRMSIGALFLTFAVVVAGINYAFWVGLSLSGMTMFVVGLGVGLYFLFKGRRENIGYEMTPAHIEHEVMMSSRQENKIGGVCAYVAQKLGVDATIVRVATLFLGFITFPVVPFLYLVLLFFVPKSEKLQVQ